MKNKMFDIEMEYLPTDGGYVKKESTIPLICQGILLFMTLGLLLLLGSIYELSLQPV